jgi:hypothetical protein
MLKANAHGVAVDSPSAGEVSGREVRRLTSSRWIPWLGSCIVPGEAKLRIDDVVGESVLLVKEKCYSGLRDRPADANRASGDASGSRDHRAATTPSLNPSQ